MAQIRPNVEPKDEDEGFWEIVEPITTKKEKTRGGYFVINMPLLFVSCF